MGTTRLVVCAAAFRQEFLRDGLIKDFSGSRRILRADLQFHPTDQVGVKPVEPNHVVIAERASDARRFETALGNEGFREIPEFSNGDQLGRFVSVKRHGGGMI